MSHIALDNGLDLGKLFTTGSLLHINEDYDNVEHHIETENFGKKKDDVFGEPIMSLEGMAKQMISVDQQGFVKKKILEHGGGLPLQKECTVSVAYSGFWEGCSEPFDATKSNKPQVVNMQDTGLLPGLEIAIQSMLVGETAVFLLSYELMYGEMGIPPRIKPKSDCIFYIKLLKSILTPDERNVDNSEKNMFHRIHKEVLLLYTSGATLHKSKNFFGAIKLFRKGVAILQSCRLADEAEEMKQQKLLIKLYLNLAVSYNITKQPLKACIACNELNTLNSLWNNGKALYQNAKALRMISQFDEAMKRLRRAMKLCPNNKQLEEEFLLLNNINETFTKPILLERHTNTINNEFKMEVHNMIREFRQNPNLCKLTLPEGLNDAEIEHIKEICRSEKLFFIKLQKTYLLDKDENAHSLDSDLDADME